ncbi:ssDNA binding protein [Streptomyces phage BillNye]|uniref:SsDNA binding protein n=2 Tax=Wilnyevirus billnye TaxID=2560486 RepID=A0A2L1IVR0_9CAUD|nr:single strand DNA binding protein [Streptomyces phage BillNye]AVD99256.1 ssDNA binding protein [Streptomyces phage BillNye]QBZ72340.1 ssDNA binding protein [Streptomyces phage Circinus]
MAVVKGLAAIKAHQKEQAEKAANRGGFPEMFYRVFPKVVGNEIVVRFLQELDPDMTNYSEDRGIGVIAVEHQSGGLNGEEAPKRGFMYKAVCTAGEGDCYGCERHKENYKAGWRPQQSLYINVLAEVEGELKTFVLSKGANSSFVQSLIQEAVDEGSITDANYRITKTGEGTSTQWLLKRLKSEPLDDSNAQVWDLEGSVLKNIAYEDQAEFYGKAHPQGNFTPREDSGSSSAPARPAASDDNDEW